MATPRRVTGEDRLQLIEFEGKYEIVLPAELSNLADDQLVALIMKRAGVDESSAHEILATIRKRGRAVIGYDRV